MEVFKKKLERPTVQELIKVLEGLISYSDECGWTRKEDLEVSICGGNDLYIYYNNHNILTLDNEEHVVEDNPIYMANAFITELHNIFNHCMHNDEEFKRENESLNVKTFNKFLSCNTICDLDKSVFITDVLSSFVNTTFEDARLNIPSFYDFKNDNCEVSACYFVKQISIRTKGIANTTVRLDLEENYTEPTCIARLNSQLERMFKDIIKVNKLEISIEDIIKLF